MIAASRGHGQRLATGATKADEDILLLLHADSYLAPGTLVAIIATLGQNPHAIGGIFRLLFDGGDAFSAWLSGFYVWLRAIGRHYSNSGVFVRRTTYERLCGIHPIALVEDYDFVSRLERTGRPVRIDVPPLVTFARRFKGRRRAGIVAGWLLIHTLYHVGVPYPPAQLATFYDRWRRSRFKAIQGASLSDQSYSSLSILRRRSNPARRPGSA